MSNSVPSVRNRRISRQSAEHLRRFLRSAGPLETPGRLLMQRRQRSTVQLHLLRGAMRTLLLIGCDALMLLLLRELAHGLRDLHWLGGGVAAIGRLTNPRG